MKVYLVTVIKPVNIGMGDIGWEPIRELVRAENAVFAVEQMLSKYKECELKDIKFIEES